MNMGFENNGVTARLPTSYYGGSPFEQAQLIVKHAGIEWNAGERGVLAIWNPGQARGGAVADVSPETGLVGYPNYTANGLDLKTIFNPSITQGSRINVKSSLTGANGEWIVDKTSHELESQVPKGSWYTHLITHPSSVKGPFVASKG